MTARWIAALVGVGPVSWIVDHKMTNVIQYQLLNAFRVGSEETQEVQNLHNYEELVAWLRDANTDGSANTLLVSVSVRIIYTCVTCSRCVAQCNVCADVVALTSWTSDGHRNHHTVTPRRWQSHKQHIGGQYGSRQGNLMNPASPQSSL